MLPGQPSQTLLVPAVARAAHQLLDAPLILNDPLAIGLVPEASREAILGAVDDHRATAAMLCRSLFTLRSRFVEDQLETAAVRGVRQYIMLGAGLETFPWRQPDFARDMKIFFCDHPSTLAWAQSSLSGTRTSRAAKPHIRAGRFGRATVRSTTCRIWICAGSPGTCLDAGRDAVSDRANDRLVTWALCFIVCVK